MNIGIETEYIEFKKSIGELKEACESICAMLNKHGVGTVYFGIRFFQYEVSASGDIMAYGTAVKIEEE